jgi:5-methylcytosine-specific restriction enzyme B
MEEEFLEWLVFLQKERVLLKCPTKEERFAVVRESSKGVLIDRLTPASSEQIELTLEEIGGLRSRILQSATGTPLDGELNDQSALVSIVASLRDIRYSALRRALVAVRDEMAAREAFLEIVSNWRRTVPEYKPLLLLAVLTAIETAELTENRIKFDWVSERFVEESRRRNLPREAQNAAMPFYRLTTDLFWMVSIHDLSRPPADRAEGAVGRIDYAFVREPFWSLLQEPNFRREIEQQLVVMLPTNAETKAKPRFFIEKTLVKGRPDRETGPNALGKALWSPQSDERGARIYELMTDLKPGDIIFHLVDNREICGYSTVESPADSDFIGLANTPWADRPGYRVSLRNFTPLDPTIRREWLLKDPRYEKVLMQLLQQGSRVFYNKSLELNQGAYLTQVPLELLYVVKDAYRTQTGKALPFDGSPLSTPNMKDLLENFNETAAEASLVLDSNVFHRFVASLLAKRFLILTGLSGSGKTKLALAFAQYLSRRGSPSVRLIPVGADWTSNENVIGYPDGLNPGNYLVQPGLELILYAREKPAEPCFLILDEMNLSHVERYFADFLSALESAEPIPLYTGAERQGSGRTIPHEIPIPDNLFVVGTVNIDETTYMFSPKVLDRAGVIEFRVTADDIGNVLENDQVPDLGKLVGRGQRYAETFVNAARNQSVRLPRIVQELFAQETKLFFDIFESHRAEFGFRVVHEAARFMSAYRILGGYSEGTDDWFRGAFDAVIVQKLLPKLHGSRGRLEGLLWGLFWACVMPRDSGLADFREQCLEAGQAKDGYTYSPDRVRITVSEPTYPLSADKILRMWQRLVQDQFVSFAEP